MAAAAVVVRADAAAAHWRCEVGSGKHRLAADEPGDLGGGDTAPSPFDLLLAALGACTAMTVRMVAERKGWHLASVEVELVREKRDPKAFPRENAVRRVVRLAGDLDAEQRRRLLEVADRCPVHRALSQGVDVVTAGE